MVKKKGEYKWVLSEEEIDKIVELGKKVAIKNLREHYNIAKGFEERYKTAEEIEEARLIFFFTVVEILSDAYYLDYVAKDIDRFLRLAHIRVRLTIESLGEKVGGLG
ncbi:MAG: hypothetical protein QW052_06155 [Candidatus Nitrosocaldaceae archaeon]